jgi:uncharacterized protein (TIGR04255 family)
MTAAPRTLESQTGPPVSRRHYEHAPVLEAALDIQITPELTDLQQITSLGENEDSRYPQRGPLLVMESSFSVNALAGETSLSQSQRGLGHTFINPGREVFQARLNGFAYSQLAPYDTWETFRGEAIRLWNKCKTCATSSTRVHRLGLRYVNRLDLTEPVGELKDYLLTAPDVAPGLPQLMSGFMMQLNLPQPDIQDAVMTIREGIIAPPRPNTVSILLDIDLTQSVDLALPSEDVWTKFEALHGRADEAFERCITDKVRTVIR